MTKLILCAAACVLLSAPVYADAYDDGRFAIQRQIDQDRQRRQMDEMREQQEQMRRQQAEMQRENDRMREAESQRRGCDRQAFGQGYKCTW